MRHRALIASLSLAAAALLAQRIAAEVARAPAGAAQAPPPAPRARERRAAAAPPSEASRLARGPRGPARGAPGAAGAAAADAAVADALARRDARQRPSPALAAAGERTAAAAPRIELDPLEVDPASGTATATGFDPLRPRELVLWRLVGRGAAVMARGHSASDGALAFPRLLVPHDGLSVVVAPAGASADAPDASLPRALEPAPPEAPYGEIVATAPGHWRLRVRASEAGGEVLVAGVDGEVFARRALAADPRPPSIELELEVPASDSHLWLAQVLADGRRSEWRLAAPFAASPGEQP